MVGVAQLVEHPVVVRDVAGSSPVAHPTNLFLGNTYFYPGELNEADDL